MTNFKTAFVSLFMCSVVGTTMAQSQKKVLQELWSNVECGPCQSAQLILEAQVAANPNDVIFIGYHANYPSPTDPMYLENTTELDYLMNFYQVFGVPNMATNGDVGSPTTDQPVIDSLLSLTVPLELHPQLNIVGNTLNATIQTLTTDTPPASTNLVLRVAVTETMDYQTPPGVINLTHFPDVFRKFLTNTSGDSFVPAVNGDSVTSTFSITMPIHWNPDNLKIKAWIIDTTDTGGINPKYNVINSAEASPDMTNSLSENQDGLTISTYPNPATTQFIIDINAISGKDITVQVFNAVGQLVQSRAKELNVGSNKVKLDVEALNSGTYLVKIISEGHVFSKKLIIR